MMSNAIERQLPELTFDDVSVTIDQLAKKVTRALSKRISVIVTGDKTISSNRSEIMQLYTRCTAVINAVSKERGEKIKEEGTEKLKEYQQICEGNALLLESTKKTIEYIVSASTFFTETKKDNEATLSARRKAQVEKDTAQHKVDVCNDMLNFLVEQKAVAIAMQTTTQHNRDGRKGEVYQLKQLEGALAPAKTWVGLLSSGAKWIWGGGAKPAETKVEGGAEPVAQALTTRGAEKESEEPDAPKIATTESVTVSAIPPKLNFKDAVDHALPTGVEQSERQRIAGKRNLMKPTR